MHIGLRLYEKEGLVGCNFPCLSPMNKVKKTISRFYHKQGAVIVKKYREKAVEKFGKDFFSEE